MNKTDQHLIDTWINKVTTFHSGSERTPSDYKGRMNRFCKDKRVTPSKILSDYETMNEKTFKRKYEQMLEDWQPELASAGLAPTSIGTHVHTVKSFFKYSRCELDFTPTVRPVVTNHNRDIEAKEIRAIMAQSPIREKTAYAFIAQSGIRPITLSKLKLKDIEDPRKEAKSYKVSVSKELNKGKFGAHVTFFGEDTAKCLRDYLATKTNPTPDNLLFSSHRNPNKPMNIKNLSRAFQYTARELRKTNALKYEIREKGKPSELRLYTLRKFFKRNAKSMGDEDTDWMMGHTIKGSAGHYAPRDPEYYRERYETKALPFLTLESPSLTDSQEVINKLNELHKKEIDTYKEENAKLNTRLKKLEDDLHNEDRALITRSAVLIREMIEEMKQDNIRTATTEALTDQNIGKIVGNTLTIQQAKKMLQSFEEIAKQEDKQPLSKEEQANLEQLQKQSQALDDAIKKAYAENPEETHKQLKAYLLRSIEAAEEQQKKRLETNES